MTQNNIVYTDRIGTDSLKWDFMEWFFPRKNSGENPLLPLWVADMDYEIPPFVNEALKKRLGHPVYGYTVRPKEYYQVLADWQKNRNNWEVKKDWIIHVPGVVGGISTAIALFSAPGDEVIFQPPVYGPFQKAIISQGRLAVENPLKETDGRYEFDFEDLCRKITAKTKILLLCSPHNPVGRVWEKDELERLAEICSLNDILLISDEIHSDLILPGYKHNCIGALSNKTITLTSIGKTFNCAGLTTASAIIPDKQIREQFNGYLQASGLGISNIFGIYAHLACYQDGAGWVDELRMKISENMRLVTDCIKSEMPLIKPVKSESTYLLWMDYSELKVNESSFNKLLVEEGGLALEMGSSFGTCGTGYFRMNVATEETILLDALQRLKTVYKICIESGNPDQNQEV